MTTLPSRSFSRPAGILAAWPAVRAQDTPARLRRVQFSGADRQAIHGAAGRYGLPAPLIAAVLADEQVRLDASDHLQGALMRLSVALPEGAGTALRRGSEWLAGRPAGTFSLGRAQMKFGTLRRLGRLGYLEVPDELGGQVRLLLDPLAAPRLVAACLRATADHWAAAGVPILHRPDLLGTLYSLGFVGRLGVHARPQASERGQLIAAHAQWLGAQWLEAQGLGAQAAAPGSGIPGFNLPELP